MVWLPLLIVSAAAETTCLLQGSRVTKPGRTLDDKLNHQALVVPELKLVFTYIQKNSCTAFADLINDINDIPHGSMGDVAERQMSSAWASGWTQQDLTDAFHDPTWMFATFVRDPVERLVSAYVDKCVERFEEVHRCPSQKEDTTLDEIVFSGELEKTSDSHWIPQSTVFKDLGTPINAYDYVGVVSKDRSEVGRQVRAMLELAIERGNVSKDRAEEILGFGEYSFPQEDIKKKEARKRAFKRHKNKEIVMHNYGHNTTTEDYISPEGIAKATKIYQVDYDTFAKWL